MRRFLLVWAFLCSLSLSAQAQYWLHPGDGETNNSMFRPLSDWPTPNEYRTAAGSPGAKYWQQRVDYKIDTALDTLTHTISGKERITYKNNSPDVLSYIWMQMDQNLQSRNNSRSVKASGALPNAIPPAARRFLNIEPFDGGFQVQSVKVMDATGKMGTAETQLNDTVMKIKLPSALKSGGTAVIEIEWKHVVPDDGRGMKEKTKNGWLYANAQWFPRVCVYDDNNGWQTDQYMGRGEFHLEFGNYDVSLTVPWNHILDATGVLQNPQEVLTGEQIRRLNQAYQVLDLKKNDPVFIVRPDEIGKASIRPKSSGTLTWRFKAENVRDFAWITSRAHVWDAAGFKYRPTDKPIALHSLYPIEAMPMWDRHSTRAIWETLSTYGRMSLEYPYPKAVSANGQGLGGGMEYPMIAFNGGRPNAEGKFTEAQERGLISVTIHEVGHNWFPMIISSDERKWTWQDEGVNSFVQYYTEQDYARRYQGHLAGAQFKEGKYPSRRGPAKNIIPYMKDADQVPIMTHSDLIHKDFGNNGYAKPATGLVMLREHILGPVAFDEAFREYSQKWAFKHPAPYDFFRTLEENAGEDLAWFWRGWFYTTYATDQALTEVKSQEAKELLGDESKGKFYHRITIENKGGLLMPVVLDLTYEDDTKERIKLPADIWRNNELKFVKGFFSGKALKKVVLDPDEAFADIEPKNNSWEVGQALTEPKPAQEVPKN